MKQVKWKFCFACFDVFRKFMKKTNRCSQKILASKNVCSYNEDMSTEITNNYIEEYTTQEKLQILADAAKYDVYPVVDRR